MHLKSTFTFGKPWESAPPLNSKSQNFEFWTFCFRRLSRPIGLFNYCSILFYSDPSLIYLPPLMSTVQLVGGGDLSWNISYKSQIMLSTSYLFLEQTRQYCTFYKQYLTMFGCSPCSPVHPLHPGYWVQSFSVAQIKFLGGLQVPSLIGSAIIVIINWKHLGAKDFSDLI